MNDILLICTVATVNDFNLGKTVSLILYTVSRHIMAGCTLFKNVYMLLYTYTLLQKLLYTIAHLYTLVQR